MARSDVGATLAELESSLPLFSYEKRALEASNSLTSLLQNEMLRLDEEFFRQLCKSLGELVQQRFKDVTLADCIKLISQPQRKFPELFSNLLSALQMETLYSRKVQV